MTANAGYHAYATGDVLTAAQVQYNLQNQTVMYFASSAARTTALSAVQVEGMVSYIPANGLEYYNGSTWTTVSNPGDITGVTAGKGLTGGGTSGDVTVSLGTAAKGDLVVGTGTTTAAALAVGNNGETLVADSSTSTGLRYQVGNGLAQGVINGGFDIWQRSTSSTTLGAYTTADRWYLGAYSGTGTFAQETTVVPSGSRYSLKFTASATSQPYAYQAIETANAQQFAGQTVTLSMKLAASTSVGVAIGLEYSTSVDNGVAGSWTGITPSAGGTATPSSTTFITGTGTFAVPSTAKSLRVGLYTTSTIANTVVIYLGQTQLELGSVATQFRRAGGTIQGELAACQRYLPAVNPGSQGNDWLLGIVADTSHTFVNVKFPTTARVLPTGITVGAASGFRIVNYANAAGAASAIAFDGAGIDTARIYVTSAVGTPAIVAGNGAFLQAYTTGNSILFTGCEL